MQGRVWELDYLFTLSSHPFHMPSNVFTLQIKLAPSPPPHHLALGLTHCICGQLLDPMGIHLLRYAHGGKKITFHDVVQDVFASLAKMYSLLHDNNPFFFFHKSLTSFL
jgi:hypothetical protein